MDNKNIYLITFIATNGGLLYGLNMAGISGCVDTIQSIFGLSNNSIGLTVSVLILGCLIGSLFVGKLADLISRKNVFIISAIMMALSSLGLFFANHILLIILFRFISGLAVGAVSVVSPMYISEIAPSDKRGTLVSFNQFAITIGILVAYLFNYYFEKYLDSSIAWHYMLGVPFIFSVVFLLLTIAILPKSPRWLMGQGLEEQAHKVLTFTLGKKLAKQEFDSLVNSFSDSSNKTKVKFGDIFKEKTGKVVLLGTVLAVLQQAMGINAVVNYAPVIFAETGSQSDPFFQSILVGLINTVSTVIALKFVDRLGRKLLLLIGSVGSMLSLFYLVFAMLYHLSPTSILVAVLIFIGFFAATWSPIMWVVISEIYPNRIRSTAMSFSTAMSWTSSFLIVQFSPSILASLGSEFLFGLFGLFALASFFFVWKYIPETKSKTLEQIEKELGLD
ncbi:sugar porter family MFS transporter [Olivibacter sitiensis]|uniref:sugar porter family MFS transporter n=1 Tax=Olivibacter sitiensis TaxID=376470 RepID=UPI00056C064F|nr:sugar porter family MFS transporter [Olivibacter sitiensis]